MSRVLAVCHPAGGTSGVFHDAARTAGHVIDEWLPAERPEPPRPLGEYAALVVLGGDQNVSEQDRFPYLTAEIALLREWLPSGRPVLGVCLGAQLLAEAAGGRVVRAHTRELGWLGVEVLPRAADDPVLGFAPAHLTALQWHSFAVEPPPGAVVLARSPVCAQAFRLGSAWGVQFHPEVDRAILDAWLEDLDRGIPPQARDAELLEAGVAEHLETWNGVGRQLFGGFLTQVG